LRELDRSHEGDCLIRVDQSQVSDWLVRGSCPPYSTPGSRVEEERTRRAWAGVSGVVISVLGLE
jgi:hypothetical protein